MCKYVNYHEREFTLYIARESKCGLLASLARHLSISFIFQMASNEESEYKIFSRVGSRYSTAQLLTSATCRAVRGRVPAIFRDNANTSVFPNSSRAQNTRNCAPFSLIVAVSIGVSITRYTTRHTGWIRRGSFVNSNKPRSALCCGGVPSITLFLSLSLSLSLDHFIFKRKR